MRFALALLLAFPACSKKQPEKTAAASPPRMVDAGPPALSTHGADITWLIGTWERQSRPKEWLLFNAPNEVGVLAGSPPALTGKGEFIPNGRSVSLFFRGVGGNTVERVFEGSADGSELREQGTANATYRRGTPP